jgi:hypothetical protein
MKLCRSLFNSLRVTSLYILVACFCASCTSSEQPVSPAFPGKIQIPYETKFPRTENPISENNIWINGRAIGREWADVQSLPGLVFSTESGKGEYRDATAILAGAWSPNQSVEATVHSVSQNSKIFEEVELRLRSFVSQRKITGYEVNFRCTSDGTQYVQIVRWNGPLGKFSYIASATGPGLRDGDLVKATIVGNKIAAFINGALVVQGTDSSFSSGNPGLGFYNEGGTSANNSDFGFTSFRAEQLLGN